MLVVPTCLFGASNIVPAPCIFPLMNSPLYSPPDGKLRVPRPSVWGVGFGAGVKVYGLILRVEGLRFRSLGCGAEGLVFWVWSMGIEVWGLRVRMWGLGSGV